MTKKLNLGCGKDIKQNYVNLDVVKLPGVDIVHNLEKYPYPFKDNEFDEVYCHHVLEHMTSIVKPLEELWRITRKGGKLVIEVPISPGIGAFVDPTHKSFYTFGTFDYFTENNMLNYYSKARFKILKRRIIFSTNLYPLKWFYNLATKIVNSDINLQKAYFFNFSFIFPAYLIDAELEVVK